MATQEEKSNLIDKALRTAAVYLPQSPEQSYIAGRIEHLTDATLGTLRVKELMYEIQWYICKMIVSNPFNTQVFLGMLQHYVFHGFRGSFEFAPRNQKNPVPRSEFTYLTIAEVDELAAKLEIMKSYIELTSKPSKEYLIPAVYDLFKLAAAVSHIAGLTHERKVEWDVPKPSTSNFLPSIPFIIGRLGLSIPVCATDIDRVIHMYQTTREALNRVHTAFPEKRYFIPEDPNDFDYTSGNMAYFIPVLESITKDEKSSALVNSFDNMVLQLMVNARNYTIYQRLPDLIDAMCEDEVGKVILDKARVNIKYWSLVTKELHPKIGTLLVPGVSDVLRQKLSASVKTTTELDEFYMDVYLSVVYALTTFL